ncbi:MAG: NADH-quinone oxidoreductase subunit A [Caldimicrobium sp.]
MQGPDTFLPTLYLPILIILIIGFLFGLGGLIFGALIRPKYYYSLKLIPYECGNEPSGLPWQKITIRFFPIAILFAIFDVEVGLLYAWCIGFSELKELGFYSMLLFLIILLIGFIYDLKMGILDWRKRS